MAKPVNVNFDESTTQKEFDNAINRANENGVSIEIDSVNYNEQKQITYISGKASSLLSIVNFSTEGEMKSVTIDKSRGKFISSLSVKLEK